VKLSHGSCPKPVRPVSKFVQASSCSYEFEYLFRREPEANMDEMLLRWAIEPWYMRVFLLYLFAAICILAVRSLRVAWRLGVFPRRNRISFQNVRDDAMNAKLLAESALSNRFFCKLVTDSDIAVKSGDKKALLCTIQTARSRFLYLWELCCAEVGSIKRLLLLTLLLSSVVVLGDIQMTFTDAFENRTTGVVALFMAIAELLRRFSLGLFVCTIFFAISGFLEGTLVRRRIHWNYLCTRWKNILTGDCDPSN
jgi:hypothetical protein